MEDPPKFGNPLSQIRKPLSKSFWYFRKRPLLAVRLPSLRPTPSQFPKRPNPGGLKPKFTFCPKTPRNHRFLSAVNAFDQHDHFAHQLPNEFQWPSLCSSWSILEINIFRPPFRKVFPIRELLKIHLSRPKHPIEARLSFSEMVSNFFDVRFSHYHRCSYVVNQWMNYSSESS